MAENHVRYQLELEFPISNCFVRELNAEMVERGIRFTFENIKLELNGKHLIKVNLLSSDCFLMDLKTLEDIMDLCADNAIKRHCGQFLQSINRSKIDLFRKLSRVSLFHRGSDRSSVLHYPLPFNTLRSLKVGDRLQCSKPSRSKELTLFEGDVVGILHRGDCVDDLVQKESKQYDFNYVRNPFILQSKPAFLVAITTKRNLKPKLTLVAPESVQQVLH